jgi:thiamine kinase-like enzyme
VNDSESVAASSASSSHPYTSLRDSQPEPLVSRSQSNVQWEPMSPIESASVPDTQKQFIREQCRACVPSWASVSDSDIIIEELNGGLTNILFTAHIADNVSLEEKQHRRVVIRFFGQDTEVFFKRESEQKIAKFLSDHGFGSRILGSFEEFGGGRIESFLRGRTLHCIELSFPNIYHRMAHSLASLHRLEAPLEDQSPSVFRLLEDWLNEAVKSNVPDLSVSTSNVVFTTKQLHDEVEFLKHKLATLNSPVVFCHNDLQEGNIIYDKDSHCVHVIDYEYAAFNFRGFDLANHLCEHYIDYQYPQYPYFSVDIHKYPSKSLRWKFLREYLECWKDLQSRDVQAADLDTRNMQVVEDDEDDVQNETDNSNVAVTVTDEEVRQLYDEVKWFMLASHALWSFWGIVQSQKAEIEFGYIEYAHSRMVEYFRLKTLLLDHEEEQQQTAHQSTVSLPVARASVRVAADVDVDIKSNDKQQKDQLASQHQQHIRSVTTTDPVVSIERSPSPLLAAAAIPQLSTSLDSHPLSILAENSTTTESDNTNNFQ